jgi:hypothetical protein
MEVVDVDVVVAVGEGMEVVEVAMRAMGAEEVGVIGGRL